MKRDMDLVREILLALESGAVDEDVPHIDGYERRTVGFHVGLLSEAGMVVALDARTRDDPDDWLAQRMTWAGYDFLDQIRDETRWEETKTVVANVRDWSFSAIKAAATGLTTQAISDRLSELM